MEIATVPTAKETETHSTGTTAAATPNGIMACKVTSDMITTVSQGVRVTDPLDMTEARCSMTGSTYALDLYAV